MSGVSLQQYLKQSTHLTENLAELIQTIADTCKQIDDCLQQGALAGNLGSLEHENIQGETQKKLDVISNDLLVDALSQHPNVAALASEELDDMTLAQPNGDFLVLFDPLDGSSNIDINMCVGTIFSILAAPKTQPQTADFFQKGSAQVAAGYVMYGPSTMLVFTTGQGVHIFTLEPRSGVFYLTQDQVKIPSDTQEFAINASNQRHWEAPVQRYIGELLEGRTGVRAKDFNMRWVACMVGDVHRILCRGGVFLYPYDSKDPNKAGRLRLMYEANPLGLIIQQAGGMISTGRTDILEVQPEGLHQRIPVILGAAEEVSLLTQYHTHQA